MKRISPHCIALGTIFASMTMLFTGAVMAQPNKAVTPVLSGTYIAQIMHFCQASIANSGGGVNVNNSGDANYNVVTVSFDPNAGLATVCGLSVDGSPLIVDTAGYPMTPKPNQQIFPYSNDSATFTITITRFRPERGWN
jgi:hypothetical protein